MYLNLYDFNVDGIYINRIIPINIDNDFFDNWKSIQRKYITEIESVFGSIPIYKIRWFEKDINGVNGLEEVMQEAFNSEELFKVLKIAPNEIFEKIEDGYLLKIAIPFSNKEDFDLYHSGGELIIKVGNFKRNIPLPDVMIKCEVKSAKFKESNLEVLFQ